MKKAGWRFTVLVLYTRYIRIRVQRIPVQGPGLKVSLHNLVLAKEK